MKRFWGSILPAFAIVTLVAPQIASAEVLSDRVKELEQQIEQLNASLQEIKHQTATTGPVVQELSNRVSRVENTTQQPAAKQVASLEERVARVERVKKAANSHVFFKGGYSQSTDDRGNAVFPDLFGFNGLAPGGTNSPTFFNDGDEGYYVAAGIEHQLTDSLWGLLPGIEAWAEITFGVTRFESNDGNDAASGNTRVVPAAVVGLILDSSATGGNPPFQPEANVLGRAADPDNLFGITLTQFTLTAAPKIKVPLPINNLKAWVIPAGMAFHVISPPSNAGTYIAPGVLFGGGLEYTILDAFTLGLDGRYHIVGDLLDGVDADYWQAGGSIGFVF